jgi:hypothetical protein
MTHLYSYIYTENSSTSTSCQAWIYENYAKATNRYRESFRYLRQKFPHTKEAKMKVGNLIGLRIKEINNYGNYGALQEIIKTPVLK